jgi:hypothetical protein
MKGKKLKKQAVRPTTIPLRRRKCLGEPPKLVSIFMENLPVSESSTLSPRAKAANGFDFCLKLFHAGNLGSILS